MKMCNCNAETKPSWEWTRCTKCGQIRIGNHSNWGIAAGKYFNSVAEAEFYKKNGKRPE